MTTEIILTLSILAGVIILFITEKLPADLIALITFSALVLTGLVTPNDAIASFSSPAVITTWAVFILSGGLSRTGVASWIGHQVLRLSGESTTRTLLVVMLISALLSGFMNNVGVTALMLPVVLDICRRTEQPPSLMLIPLAFSSLLGGMGTLIGTTSNILISDILVDYGVPPLHLFDFAPFGLTVTLAGILYLLIFGKKLLPVRNMAQDFEHHERDMTEAFAIEERLFVITLPPGTQLDGRTLGQSRFGSVLGLNVIGVMRAGHTNLGPNPDTVLRAGDKLLVTGRADRLISWTQAPQFKVISRHITPDHLTSDNVTLMEGKLTPNSSLIGKNLEQLHFRQEYGGVVLSLCREGTPVHYRLESIVLQPGDTLLMLVDNTHMDNLAHNNDLELTETNAIPYHLEDALVLIQITPDSHLIGHTIMDAHLGDAYRMGVFGIMREGKTILIPEGDEEIMEGDQLLIKIRPESIATLESLHGLEIDAQAHPSYADMESDTVGLLEVVVSPQSTLPGKTLREMHYREKYGLSVLAIWRGGRTHRSGLRDMPIRFGDALLVFGPRERLRMLASDPDFIPLTVEAQLPPRIKKAPIVAALMVAMVLAVGMGWLPIAAAAVISGTLMVLSGSLKMNEAYRDIRWNAVFLIAGMLPLGVAMQTSGTAEYLATGMIDLVQPLGTHALIGGFFLLTVLASQIMPNPAVTVLMAPIALTTASNLGYSPYTFAMAITVAASSVFLSPVGTPANTLIMGPGGYKFTDYVKIGLPLVLVIMLLTVFVLPLFWPL